MYYIGVDLGGTNIAIGIVSYDGSIVRKESIPTLRHRTAEEIMEDIITLCLKIIADEGLTLSDIYSIGIGSPGIADPVNGVLVYANNLNFKNLKMREIIQKRINLPVFINNDANCAALGESVCGAAKGFKNSITITLGTGLGGGIVINGKIFSGSFYGGAEVGHHVIVVNGEQCTCGRKGCFEAYAAATAIIRDTRIAVARNPNSLIYKLVDGDISLITAKTAFDAAEAGDETATNIIDTYIDYLAEGLANLINIIQPEIIVIGGGVSAQGDNLLIPLKEKIIDKSFGKSGKFVDLKIAELGNDAGIIGAALQCKD